MARRRARPAGVTVSDRGANGRAGGHRAGVAARSRLELAGIAAARAHQVHPAVARVCLLLRAGRCLRALLRVAAPRGPSLGPTPSTLCKQAVNAETTFPGLPKTWAPPSVVAPDRASERRAGSRLPLLRVTLTCGDVGSVETLGGGGKRVLGGSCWIALGAEEHPLLRLFPQVPPGGVTLSRPLRLLIHRSHWYRVGATRSQWLAPILWPAQRRLQVGAMKELGQLKRTGRMQLQTH